MIRVMEAISKDGRAVMSVDWDPETGDKVIGLVGGTIPLELGIDERTCVDLAQALLQGVRRRG